MNPIQRIARNSAAPIVTQLLNKVVDLGFAAVVLRLLGTTGNGEYAFAVLVWLYTKTFTDFGLATLAMRDVARDHDLAGEYLGLTTLLRLALWLVTLPIIAGFTLVYRQFFDLSSASLLAIIFLILSIVPDSYSDAANAIFNAFERHGHTGGIDLREESAQGRDRDRAPRGRLGGTGLAVTALITNLATAGLFGLLLRRLGVRIVWTLPGAQARRMLLDAWPLFLNALLAGLFFARMSSSSSLRAATPRSASTTPPTSSSTSCC